MHSDFLEAVCGLVRRCIFLCQMLHVDLAEEASELVQSLIGSGLMLYLGCQKLGEDLF